MNEIVIKFMKNHPDVHVLIKSDNDDAITVTMVDKVTKKRIKQSKTYQELSRYVGDNDFKIYYMLSEMYYKLKELIPD